MHSMQWIDLCFTKQNEVYITIMHRTVSIYLAKKIIFPEDFLPKHIILPLDILPSQFLKGPSNEAHLLQNTEIKVLFCYVVS